MAFPGVSGALENTSYGVSGETGEPAANPGPSGGTIPGPRVLSEINVECASTLIEIVPMRGDGDGDGDGPADCALARLDATIMKTAMSVATLPLRTQAAYLRHNGCPSTSFILSVANEVSEDEGLRMTGGGALLRYCNAISSVMSTVLPIAGSRRVIAMPNA